MSAVSLPTLALVAIAVIVLLGAIAAAVLLIVFSAVRRRRQRRREEEARRALAELSPFSASGVIGLAAGLEGVRLATMAIGVGSEIAKQGFAPVVAGSLRRLADMTEADRPALRRAIADDGTVTLMFSDIEGSTSLNQALGDEAWLELLREHDDIVKRNVRSQRGQVVKTQGDSFMVAFREVPAAVSCAVEIQRAFAAAELSQQHPVRVRIGLHTGEVTKQGKDLFGINVVLAARVADAASGGEVLVSAAVRKHATDGFRYDRGRKVTLKGFSSPEQVYAVEWR